MSIETCGFSRMWHNSFLNTDGFFTPGIHTCSSYLILSLCLKLNLSTVLPCAVFVCFVLLVVRFLRIFILGCLNKGHFILGCLNETNFIYQS